MLITCLNLQSVMLLKQYQFTITLSNEIFINLSYCNNHTYSVPQYFLKNRVFLDIFHIHLQPQQKNHPLPTAISIFTAPPHCHCHFLSLSCWMRSSFPKDFPWLFHSPLGIPSSELTYPHLRRRIIIIKHTLGGDMFVPRRVSIPYVVGRNYENPWI